MLRDQYHYMMEVLTYQVKLSILGSLNLTLHLSYPWLCLDCLLLLKLVSLNQY